MKRLLLGGSLVPLLLLATACTGSDETPENASAPAGQTLATAAFTDCGTLTAPLPAPTPTAEGTAPPTAGNTAPPTAAEATVTATGGTARPAGAAGSGRPLPTVTLPCLTGSTQVPVDALRGPAVLNIWASWCPPCRKELPAFQRLSEQTTGRLRVIGVNTQDSRSAAQSIGTDFGLRFPILFDPDNRLRLGLGRNVMPITLFVDEEGRIRHRDETGALDDAELAGLVRQHLGVAVPS